MRGLDSALRLLASILLLLPSTACDTVERYSLTHRLWNNTDMCKVSEPAPNPNLALFEATNRDVLVQYDALSEQHSAVTRRRSYYLRPNQERIAAGNKPKWIKSPMTNGMPSILVLSPEAAATNPPPEQTAYAVTTQTERGFSLYQPSQSKETFDLPVYDESSGTATRLALTPFAVAGDIVMVGAVAAFVGLVLWVRSGAPTQ